MAGVVHKLVAKLVVDFGPALDDAEPVAFGVGCDGAVCALDSRGEELRSNALGEGTRTGTEPLYFVDALNVAGDGEVWVYDGRFLVRIVRGEYRRWEARDTGAHALAVRGERVFFVDRSTGRFLQLGADGVARVEGGVADVVIIVDESGEPLGNATSRGVGGDLYLFKDTRVSGMSEDEIVRDFPDLTSDDIRACLAFAADRERRLFIVPAA